VILRDYIDELSDEIGRAIRAKEAGGRINQDIEELIEMKNTAILLKVRSFITAFDLEVEVSPHRVLVIFSCLID
jgi:hypothetical protein